MSKQEAASIACPYCGEALDIFIHTDDPDHRQQEQCHVCRQTIAVSTHIEDGVTQVQVHR